MRSGHLLFTVMQTLWVWASLSLLPASACPEEPWDGDGGLTVDYSSVPWLEWAGPEKPGTFRMYLDRKGSRPFSIEHLYSSSSSTNSGCVSKALVLVDSGLYRDIQAMLGTYVSDLELDGYRVEVYGTSGGTAEDLKTFLVNHSDNLSGCVFIGDLPAAWYELDELYYEEFPCDLYYMDLDGLWIDSDSDGLWDDHQAGAGDEGPEIFIGRIDASMMSGDEAVLTNDYLDKNHTHRKGGFPVSGYALTYTEDDWIYFPDIRTSIKNAYADFDDIPGPYTNRDDYLQNRVPNPAYEFIQLACHSDAFGHYFYRGGVAWNHDIQAAVPYAVFFNLFACSAMRFTEKDFLGGSYIYNQSETCLAVIGSTKPGSMMAFKEFYTPFGAKETFGEAFRVWFNVIAPYSSSEKLWHFGMTVGGDPFLRLPEKPALVMNFPEGLPEGALPPGPETRIRVEILPGLQNFVRGTGAFHYRFHPGDPYTTAALTPLGKDLYEAVLPNTRPGDEPEFYFSAKGDFGTSVCAPPHAPENVYSFDVYLLEQVWKDDFETDLGWSVENTNVIAGAWGRGDPSATEAQPEDDHTEKGTLCYVTGKLGGDISLDDLDGGPTRLVSPTLDLSGEDAELSFYLWFHHSEEGKEQPLKIHLSNDDSATWVLMDSVSHDPGWHYKWYRLSEHVSLSDEMKIRFTARDVPDDGIVEALVDDIRIERCLFSPSLWADAYSIPLATGLEMNLFLEAGKDNAFRLYLVLGTLSGTSPGFALPGGQQMPINWDYLTGIMLDSLGSPTFKDFMGILDGSGTAVAVLDLPRHLHPGLLGSTLSFAYALSPPPGWDFCSNPIDVIIEP